MRFSVWTLEGFCISELEACVLRILDEIAPSRGLRQHIPCPISRVKIKGLNEE